MIEIAVNREAEKLYDVEGLVPFDEFWPHLREKIISGHSAFTSFRRDKQISLRLCVFASCVEFGTSPEALTPSPLPSDGRG
ncbi:MAG: hypothetical protein ABIQ35_15425 [Verrucomicrobiota bacterium]